MTAISPLLVRALNYWRDRDDLTYAGLRQIIGAEDDSAADDAAYRTGTRLGWANPCRYRQYTATKGLDQEGNPEYRDCFASSPTTAATEAWILNRLASLPAFTNHAAVFSYCLPEGGNSAVKHSYRYYYDGYVRRNELLHQIAKESEVVLVLDIRAFYPSIKADATQDAFSRALGRAGTSVAASERKGFERFVGITLERAAHVGGIPIGPAIGHVLANEALRPLDELMSQSFGRRYTRYVDDIAIGMSRATAAETEERIQEHLDGIGLALHPGKRDLLSASQWMNSAPGAARRDSRPRGQLFDRFMLRLAHYAASGKSAVSDLCRRLRDDEFRLPALAFRQPPPGRLFDAQKRWIAIARHDLRLSLEMAQETPDSLIKSAHRLRVELNAAIIERFAAADRSSDGGPTRSRWATNITRFQYARWLHMATRAMLMSTRPPEQARVALGDLMAVHEGLLSGRVDGVLRFPGGPCRLISELMAAEERYPDQPDWHQVRAARAEADAVMTLTAHGLVAPPDAWVHGNADGDRVLMNRLTGRAGLHRQTPDLSAVDEIDSLLTEEVNSDHSVRRLLHSRADESELSEADRLEILLRS